MTEQEKNIIENLAASVEELLQVLANTYKHSAYYMMADYQANDEVNKTENWLTRGRKRLKDAKLFLNQ